MKKPDKYIGMDVHQATTVVCVLDAEGKVVLETTVETQAAAMIRLLENISGRLHVTFEETTQAAWLYEVVRGYAAEVIVCDPRRNKLLSEGSKADKVDARKLAELLRAAAETHRAGSAARMEWLYEELDQIGPLRRRAKQAV